MTFFLICCICCCICFLCFLTSEIKLPGSDQLYEQQPIPRKIHRGHVVPFETLTYSEGSALATFAYTNAIPQYGSFNCGQWRKHEGIIRNYAKNTCASKGGTLYLVTGISEAKLHWVQNDIQAQRQPMGWFPNDPKFIMYTPKIAIPNSMWTVGCCRTETTPKQVLGAFAVIGNNVPLKDEILMSSLSVRKIEKVVKDRANDQSIDFFPGNIDCYTAV